MEKNGSIAFKKFTQYPELRYGLSEKSDGPMERGSEILSGAAESKNRRVYFQARGIPFERVVGVDSQHRANVRAVSEADRGSIVPETDGLVTTAKNLFLSVTVADCFPIYLYDPRVRAAGLAHAGWRGIVRGVSAATVEALTRCGSQPNDLLVGIGPGIQKCHFEIQEDVRGQFKAWPFSLIEHGGKKFVDLPAIIMHELRAAGIPAEHVENSGACTYCKSDTYFSYRRDKPSRVEIMIAYIGVETGA